MKRAAHLVRECSHDDDAVSLFFGKHAMRRCTELSHHLAWETRGEGDDKHTRPVFPLFVLCKTVRGRIDSGRAEREKILGTIIFAVYGHCRLPVAVHRAYRQARPAVQPQSARSAAFV